MFKNKSAIQIVMKQDVMKVIGISLIIVAIISSFVFLMLKIDFDKQAVFLCETVSENPNIDMTECPAHKSNVPWLIISGFVVSAILAIAGLVLIFNKIKIIEHKDEIEFKIDTSRLDEDEKKILDILRNKEGSSYQSDLIKETTFSKVKITRILDKMELKKIIERKRRGMTNIIVLK